MLGQLTMSSLTENSNVRELGFLSVREQEVKQVIVEYAAEHGGRIPSLGEIQQGMVKRGYKNLSISRLSVVRDQIIEKGHLRIQIVDGEEKSA